MELEIRGKNLEITDEIEKYVEKRLERVKRRLGKRGECKVELTKASTKSRNDRIVAQVTINVNGTLLRAQTRGPGIFPAIDSVTDVMARQASRYKLKPRIVGQARKAGKGATIREKAGDRSEEQLAEEPLPGMGKVVRAKRFKLKPMSVEEAITQMELLDHNFFMFMNAGSNQYSVIYRRQDGNYGIIEPDVA